MRSQSRSTRMWGVTVAGLCVLWFASQAGAVPLESWDEKIPPNKRFKVLLEFDGAAVLDKETGLVWEQAPDITGGPKSDGRRSWAQATHHCVNRTVGGTVGWRLPSVVELKSVQDPTLGAPFVPVSVFTGLQSSNYWSATLVAEDSTFVWSVGFLIGSVFSHDSRTNGSLPTWCVRGGMNADSY